MQKNKVILTSLVGVLALGTILSTNAYAQQGGQMQQGGRMGTPTQNAELPTKGGAQGNGNRPMDNTYLLEFTGLSEDELKTYRESGLTIEKILEEEGFTEDEIAEFFEESGQKGTGIGNDAGGRITGDTSVNERPTFVPQTDEPAKMTFMNRIKAFFQGLFSRK